MSKRCIVHRACSASADNTLTLEEGAEVEVVSDLNPDWWYVKSASAGEGYYPAACLKDITPSSSSSSSSDKQQTQQQKLPPGWQQHKTAENRPYYFNLVTKKSQWNFPQEAADSPRPASVHTTPSSSSNDKSSQSAPNSPVKQKAPRPTVPNSANENEKTTPASNVSPRKPPQPPPPPPPKKRSSVDVGVGEVNREKEKLASKDQEEVHYYKLSDELKEEIARFSIREYAEEHFKKKKRWGFFGKKTVNTSGKRMSHTTKLSGPLTTISKDLARNALAMFNKLYTFAEKGNSDDLSRGEVLLDIIREQDQNRQANSENGMVEELYCQLVRQSTDNSNVHSLERYWELFAVLVLTGLLPQPSLMNVIIGHAQSFRYRSNATGAFAITVYSALCYHVQSLKSNGTLSDIIKFPSVGDIDYMNDIVPIRSAYIAEKVFGCPVVSVMYREIFLMQCDSVYPLYFTLNQSAPEVPNLPDYVLGVDSLKFTVSEQVLKLMCTFILEKGGKSRSGIFREAANTEIVKQVLKQLEVGNYNSIRLTNDTSKLSLQQNLDSSASSEASALIGDKELLKSEAVLIDDVLIIADVLKIWFRKMPEPITTYALYDMCIAAGAQESPQLAQQVLEKMPPINVSVLQYLAKFLRELSLSSHITNMEIINLSLVFAPNCIQSPNPDPQLFATNANNERKCFKLFIDVLAPV